MAGESSRWCNGSRGQVTVDLKAIKEVLLCISQLVEAVAEISGLDLNPIFALPLCQGCRMVDVRIRVQLPQHAV